MAMMMNFNDDSNASKSMPFEIEPITSAPNNALHADPRPPNRLVPPMTVAAMAFNKKSLLPDDWFTANKREAASTPAIAAMAEASMKTEMRMRSTRMPARRADSALPPTA